MNAQLPPREGWTVVAALVASTLVAYLDLQVLAVLVAPLKADLGLADHRIGWLYGVFAVFYAFAGIPVARLSDRYSRKRLIGAGMLVWSVMTLAAGLADSFGELLAARIGMGIGMAVLTPAATSLIADCMPRERTAFGVSVFQAGSVVGTGLAFVVGGWLLTAAQARGPVTIPIHGSLHPWQQVMLACGVPGLLLAPFVFALREPARAYSAAQHAALAGWREIRAFYRRNADTILLHHAGFLLLALMGFGIVFWAVTCLTRVHGMSPPDAARAFGWVYLMSGTPGSLSAPLLAARFARSGRGDANVVAAMFGAAGAVIAIAASQLMPNAFWTLVCYAPAMFFVTSPFGLAYGSLPVITPPAMRAVVASVFMFVVNLGLLLGPPLAGFLNEAVFRGTPGIRWSLLALTLVCGGAGLALLSLARRPYARSLADADALAAAAPSRTP